MPRYRHPGPISGHAPGHLRDRLLAWLDWWQGNIDPDDDDFEVLGSTDIIWVLGKLWNCTDCLPSSARDIDLDREFFTYGQMARLLKPRLLDEIADGALKAGTVRRW